MDHPENGEPYDFVTESGRMNDRPPMLHPRLKLSLWKMGGRIQRQSRSRCSYKSKLVRQRRRRMQSLTRWQHPFPKRDRRFHELTPGHASFVTDKPRLEAGSLTRGQAQQKPSVQSPRPARSDNIAPPPTSTSTGACAK